jgi:hypothetical protein
MQIQSKQFAFNTTFWLVTEIVLNLTGFDAIANYSEYIFTHKDVIQINPVDQIALIIPSWSELGV